MAVKLPDTLVPMADFPSAYAKDVQFTDGENLQDKLDEGKLGSSSSGTGLTQEQVNNIGRIPSIEGIVTSNSQAIANKADRYHEHTEYLTNIPNEYVTDTELSSKGYATKTFVTNKIAEASLSGGEAIDTTSFATDLSLSGTTLQLKNSNGSLIGNPVTLTQTSTSGNVSKLNGKKWLVIGDSISDRNITATSKWYFDYIAENTGITPVNDGRSGSGYSKNSSGIQRNIKIPDRISQLPTDVDVITILAGINDCGTNGEPTGLGTIEDTTTATFYGAVNVTISLIKAKYPQTPFGIISFLPYYNSGAVQQARVDALEKVCKANFIPFLNLYNSCGFYIKDNNFKSSFVPDGIHPNEYGHARLAPKIQQFLEYITDEHFEATYGGIIVSTNNLTVNEDETTTFKVKLDAQPSNSQNVTITIDNTNCSSDVSYLTFTSANYNVEQTVTITGYHDTLTLENLTSVITLSTRNSTATINCTITNIDETISQTRVEGVTLTDETIELTTSSTKQLTYTITPNNANNKNVSFVSSAPETVSVSSGGLITALKGGEAIITITTEDGNFQDTVTVTVTEPTGWVGKTLTVTKNFNFGDHAEIPLLIKNKSTFTASSKIKMEFEGTNTTGMTTSTNNVSTPIHACNEPIIGHSTSTNINGGSVSATQTVTEDGGLTVSYPEYTIGSGNITKYSYFTLVLNLYGTVNYSTTISKLKVTIDGEEQPILDIKPLNSRTEFTLE